MNRWLIALLLTSSALLTACGRSAAPHAASGYRLFLEEGLDNSGARITVRDSGSGKLERMLPPGAPAPDWSRYYTVGNLNGSSQISAIDPASGQTLAHREILTGYALPSLGFQGPAVGLSPNGQWIALAGPKATDNGKLSSTFLIGASSLGQPFKAVRVPGEMTFDALSNDGRNLYLVETMGDVGHYQVRLYNVGTQSLATQPVVDKREPTEPMNGVRGDSAGAAKANYVFAVYARNAGPFIHALPLDQPVAWCIDLPTTHASSWDEQFNWSLAVSEDNSKLYAVNGSTGLIAEMAPATLPRISRTAQLGPSAAPKGLAIGGAAVSHDGRTLFALAGTGIVAIDTEKLKVRARYLDGQEILSIRFSADGKWLYAATGSGNRVLQIDPSTGVVKGEVNSVEHPWAILFVQPRVSP